MFGYRKESPFMLTRLFLIHPLSPVISVRTNGISFGQSPVNGSVMDVEPERAKVMQIEGGFPEFHEDPVTVPFPAANVIFFFPYYRAHSELAA